MEWFTKLLVWSGIIAKDESNNVKVEAVEVVQPVAKKPRAKKPDFSSMKKAELVEYANVNGITINSRAKKDDIITQLKKKR